MKHCSVAKACVFHVTNEEDFSKPTTKAIRWQRGHYGTTYSTRLWGGYLLWVLKPAQRKWCDCSHVPTCPRCSTLLQSPTLRNSRYIYCSSTLPTSWRVRRASVLDGTLKQTPACPCWKALSLFLNREGRTKSQPRASRASSFLRSGSWRRDSSLILILAPDRMGNTYKQTQHSIRCDPLDCTNHSVAVGAVSKRQRRRWKSSVSVSLWLSSVRVRAS